MKTFLMIALSIGLITFQGCAQEKTKLTNQKDSVSYSIGMDIGKNLKNQSIEVDPEVLAQGIKDILDSNTTMLNEEQSQAVIMELQKQLMARHEEKINAEKDKNKIEGEAFLAENKKDKDVITLPSGLQYKIITVGTGPKPKSTETVAVHYSGTLIDGTEFDSSFKRGEPATFPVTGVIEGWVEALQLMPVGSKWKLFIPSDLAYGERGAGGVIGPNATLIFEIELLSINK
jgi:FKBP-type peptidyl-prolyl cis-trans isomerase FklB